MIQRIDGLNEKVKDLLLYARPKPPRVQAIELGPVLREAASGAMAATGHAAPPLLVEPPGVWVLADADMLRAALLNLLINACQAGGSEPIDVNVSVERNVCRISIADRGQGIPDDIRERVFEPFFTTRATGTGLGLAIVRRLVELQDGTVTLRERDGGGTIAEVTLPLATSGASAAPA